MVSIRNDGWEAHGNSIMCFNKERNGDHFLLKDLKDKNILIAILADGISNRPCDWFASEIACSKFTDYFSENISTSIEKRIKESVWHANKALLSEMDKCQGLATTFSVVIWEYFKMNLHFVNIGDSRIFKISSGKILQLSIDDSIISNRNVLTPSGRKDLKSLTNYLGKEYPDIEIHQGILDEGELLLLASDGFYDARKSTFDRDMVGLSRSGELQGDFNKLISKYEILAHDDMTALVIRRDK